MAWDEKDISVWDKPCEGCGSRRVAEVEINQDVPGDECALRSYFTCADCDKDR